MAEITPTIIVEPVAGQAANVPFANEPTANAIIVKWAAITHADQGGAARIPLRFADKTVAIAGGTYTGSAVYTLQGGFAATGPWSTLKDAQGDAIAFGADGHAVVPGNFPFYKILRASGSSGATVNVFMSCITNR